MGVLSNKFSPKQDQILPTIHSNTTLCQLWLPPLNLFKTSTIFANVFKYATLRKINFRGSSGGREIGQMNWNDQGIRIKKGIRFMRGRNFIFACYYIRSKVNPSSRNSLEDLTLDQHFMRLTIATQSSTCRCVHPIASENPWLSDILIGTCTYKHSRGPENLNANLVLRRGYKVGVFISGTLNFRHD